MFRPFNTSSDPHSPYISLVYYPGFYQHDPYLHLYDASSFVYDPSSYQHNPYLYQYYAGFYPYPYDPRFYPYPYDPSSNTYSGFVVNNPTPSTTPIQRYLAERVKFKKLKFGHQVVYVDLQRNRRGIYFHIKDMSSDDYILLDLSGLGQFLTNLYDSMLSITTHFHNHKKFSLDLEERTMEDEKKNYTFTPFMKDDGNLTLRIRMVEDDYDNTINIPANFSSKDGCYGWFKFSESLLNVLIDSGMESYCQDFGNICEMHQQLKGKLQSLLHNQIDEQVLLPGSPNHA